LAEETEADSKRRKDSSYWQWYQKRLKCVAGEAYFSVDGGAALV